MPEIKLYELGPTRSARCRWTLLEAGLDFESAGGDIGVFEDSELVAVHPLGKLPAALIDGRPVFESAAISTAIADLVPERRLVAPAGSWSRVMHEQWVCYVLTEMEAWLWSSEVHRWAGPSPPFALPAAQRQPVFEANGTLFKRGAGGLEKALGSASYLVDDRFSVTDIIAGYTVNWGDHEGLLGEFPNLRAYLERLLAREHCTLTPA